MPVSVHRQPLRAAVMLFLATTLWGGSFVAMKALGMKQEHEGNSWFITSLSLLLRFGISAVLIAPWAWRQLLTSTRAELMQGAGLGFFGGVGILFQMDGVQHTAASTAAFLTQCYCVFIPIALALHHRKIPPARSIFSCSMVLVGVALLGNIDWQNFRIGRGELESLIGSLLFTGQILWLERSEFQTNRNSIATFFMFAITAAIVLPVVIWANPHVMDWIRAYDSKSALYLITFLSLGGTFIAYATMNYWQPHIPATQAGLIYCCEPLFTSLFVLFLPALFSSTMGINYPNEALTKRLLVGGGLITVANLFLILKSSSQNSEPPPQ